MQGGGVGLALILLPSYPTSKAMMYILFKESGLQVHKNGQECT